MPQPQAPNSRALAWQDYASCRQFDPEEFFPEVGQRSEATQICRGCPVRLSCLALALGLPGPVHGTWAGFTEVELQTLRSKLAKTCQWAECDQGLTNSSQKFCPEHRLLARRRSQAAYDAKRRRAVSQSDHQRAS